MKFKQIFSLILSAAITVSSLNTVFSAEYDDQSMTITEEAALSDSALDLITEADFSEFNENIDLSSNNITFKVDDIEIEFSDTYYLEITDNQVYAPYEQLAAALWIYDVNYNSSTHVAETYWKSKAVTMTAGSTIAYVNGTAYYMSVPPYIATSNYSMYVPIKYFSEIFGYTYSYDSSSKTVNIYSTDSTSNSNDEASIIIDGRTFHSSDTYIDITDGEVFAGFRDIAGALEADYVSYDADNRMAIMVKGNTEVFMTVGSTTAIINNSTVYMTTAPYILSTTSSTCIPIKYLAQAFGYTYSYDSSSKTAYIYSSSYLATSTEATTETTTEAETTTKEGFVYPPSFGVVGVFGGRNVTFTSDTDGAVIYYSADSYVLTTDDNMVSNGGTVLFEDFYGTIYARAYYNGTWSDVSRLILKIPVTAAPEITVNDSSVTIASGTPSSFVCYTTDGTEPVVDNDGTAVNGTWIRKDGARVNSGTITVDPGSTVKAIAVRSCFTNSVSASAYVPVGSPQFTVVGAYGGRNVTFTSSTEGAVIYYSSESYILSTSDTKVSNGQTVLFEDFYGTIYARAYYNGVWSDVSRLILKIPVVDAPEVTYEGNVVRLVSSTKDSFICYTTDGTDPVVKPDGTVTNGTWIKVNGARTTKGSITVKSGTTVKAIAIRNCFTNSSISSCTVS